MRCYAALLCLASAELAKVASNETTPAPRETCDGQQTQLGVCHQSSCDEGAFLRPCKLSSWSEWSACNGNCDGTPSTRTRTGSGDCDATLEETRDCGCETVDCELSDWSEWTACSNSCGGGHRTRKRFVVNAPQFGGKACADSLAEVEECNAQSCGERTDCVWGQWAEWSACAAGERHRTRQVKVAPAFGGALCTSAITHEVSACSEDGHYTQHCVFAEWSDWSECDITCRSSLQREGLRKRTRGIKQLSSFGGRGCEGRTTEFGVCKDVPVCPEAEPVDCEFTEWGSWGECSGPCSGHRSQYRRIHVQALNGGRSCEGATRRIEPCENTEECTEQQSKDCALSQWEDWGRCLLAHKEPCGRGTQSRGRHVTAHAEGLGKPCAGTLQENRECDVECPEPSECQLTSWSDWSSCDKRCGGGQRSRHRLVQREGANCDGTDLTEVEACATESCESAVQLACEWSEWTEWSQPKRGEEVVDCGAAQVYRHRTLHLVANLEMDGSAPTVLDHETAEKKFPDAHAACQQSQTEIDQKLLPACPDECTRQDCELSEWSSWSACPCNSAQDALVRERRRQFAKYPRCDGAPCAESNLREAEACDCVAVMDKLAAERGDTGGVLTWLGLEDDPQAEICKYDTWTSWSGCSTSCGDGVQTRIRVPLHVRDGHHVHECTKTDESQPCYERDCPAPVDCEYTDAQEEECSTTCGQGVRRILRQIKRGAQYGGKPCEPAALVKFVPCGADVPCGDSHDCSLSAWSAWSPCTATCGGGSQRRHRAVVQPLKGKGRPCEGTLQDYQECNTLPCGQWQEPIDCEMAAWSGWTDCNENCQQMRTRRVSRDAEFGGVACEGGSLIEARACEGADCASDAEEACELTDWTDWGQCSRTCGGGLRSRTREFNSASGHANACDAVLEETEQCNPEKCKLPQTSVDCVLDEWSLWSECSADCRGTRTRWREIRTNMLFGGKLCNADVRDMEPCNMQCEGDAVDCEISDWTDWSYCSKQCGGGHKSRTRSISRLPAGNGHSCAAAAGLGEDDELALKEIAACNEQACHEQANCEYSEWDSWSDCSESCGPAGVRTRSRAVARQAGRFGEVCTAEATQEVEPCQNVACPEVQRELCFWDEWTDFSACSLDDLGYACGEQSVRSSRMRWGMPPVGAAVFHATWRDQNGASHDADRYTGEHVLTGHVAEVDCILERTETRPCPCVYSEVHPPLDAALTEWSQWTDCMCNVGLKERHREVRQLPRFGGQPLVAGTNIRETKMCGLDTDCKHDTVAGTYKQALECGSVFTEWFDWSACSAACGGHTTRSRHVNVGCLSVRTQAGLPPFKMGEGSMTDEVKSCGTACGSAIDCEYADWSEWTACSRTCDWGQQTRSRKISTHAMNGGAMCSAEELAEVQPCREVSCEEALSDECELTEWSAWSACSATCGTGGARHRARELVSSATGELQHCDVALDEFGDCESMDECHEVPQCVLSPWSPWGDCALPEGELCGSRSRSRTIELEGKGCAGALTDVQPCGFNEDGLIVEGEAARKHCEKAAEEAMVPQDCEVEDWSAWSACSATCGDGYRERVRGIKVPARAGGQLCDDTLREVEPCENLPSCESSQNCILSEWDEWGECTTTCGTGQMVRRRHVLQIQANGGAGCDGALVDISECGDERPSCGDDVVETCEWAAWSEWSECSVSCGDGQHQRSRSLGRHTTSTAAPGGWFAGFAEKSVKEGHSEAVEASDAVQHAVRDAPAQESAAGWPAALAVGSLAAISIAVIAVRRRRARYDPLGQQLIE